MQQKLCRVLFLGCAVLAVNAHSQVPGLPEGAETNWIVDKPEEIVGYMVFNPASVQERLPSFLRFITLEELAAGYTFWAKEHLDQFPQHSGWGISFVEVVRMETFEIDGKSPIWPEQGAAALWCARVASADPEIDLGPGKPFLVLEFWLPDRQFVTYMHKQGHYASYGEARLSQDINGIWLGSIEVSGLSVACKCTPNKDVKGPGSGGMQLFFPPATFDLKSTVRVSFAGHLERQCNDESSWRIDGEHPMADGVMLRPSTLQYGYDLVGGAYNR